MKIKTVVFCINSFGIPAFFASYVMCSKDQQEAGENLHLLSEYVIKEKCEGPFYALDEDDSLFRFLSLDTIIDWNKIETLVVK